MIDAQKTLDAINFAVGLASYDPSDPLKAPYSVENAVLAADERYGLTDDERGSVERVVRQAVA